MEAMGETLDTSGTLSTHRMGCLEGMPALLQAGMCVCVCMCVCMCVCVCVCV